MKSLSRIIVSIFFTGLMYSTVLFCQSYDDQIQNGLNNYNQGNYTEAFNNFNSLVQQMTPQQSGDLPLAGESQEVEDSESQEVEDSESTMTYDSESQEVDDSESQMQYDSETQETYTGAYPISQDVDATTVEQYSDKLEYQGDDPADVYLYRGQANLKLGNKQAALSDFDQAIALDPNYSDAYFRRAIANYNINPDKVCPDLQTAIDNGHQSAQELFNLICK
jgi:tetratricopeptide (TPR) repeat protein